MRGNARFGGKGSVAAPWKRRGWHVWGVSGALLPQRVVPSPDSIHRIYQPPGFSPLPGGSCQDIVFLGGTAMMYASTGGDEAPAPSDPDPTSPSRAGVWAAGSRMSLCEYTFSSFSRTQGARPFTTSALRRRGYGLLSGGGHESTMRPSTCGGDGTRGNGRSNGSRTSQQFLCRGGGAFADSMGKRDVICLLVRRPR